MYFSLKHKYTPHQMNDHMTINNLHDMFQSAYREGHNTESALLYVYNDLLEVVDNK